MTISSQSHVTDPTIAVAILAAGASTRMHEPKQLLRYGGISLLRRSVDAALGSFCWPVIVVLGAFAEVIETEIQGLDVIQVINRDWASGLGSSISTAVTTVEANVQAQAILLTLCDQPFVSISVFNRLADVYRESRPLIVASRFTAEGRSIYGVPAVFASDLYPQLKDLNPADGAKRLIRDHAERAIFVDIPEASFDVDTPEDFVRLQSSRAV